MEIGGEIVIKNQTRLVSILYHLSDNDINTIINTYKYQERIEIMPDIVMDNKLFKYEEGIYKSHHTFENDIKTVITLGKSIIFIYGAGRMYKLGENNILIFLLSANYISKVFKYNESSILCWNEYTNTLSLLTFDAESNRMNSKMFSTDLILSHNSYLYGDKYIIDLDNATMYKLDMENMTLKGSRRSDEDPYKIIYMGRYNPLLLIRNKEVYLYDYGGAKPVKLNIMIKGIDNNIPIADGFRMGKRLYKYIDGKVIDMNKDVSNVKIMLSNDIYLDNQSNLIKGERNIGRIFGNIFVLPTSTRIDKYTSLIPDMVNKNIKNLIISFCRSDKLFSNYIRP